MKTFTKHDLNVRDFQMVGDIWYFTTALEEFKYPYDEFKGPGQRYWAKIILARLLKVKKVDEHQYKTIIEFWKYDLRNVVKVYRESKEES